MADEKNPASEKPAALPCAPVELSDDEVEEASGGAGKVTFNPFPITHKIDKASP